MANWLCKINDARFDFDEGKTVEGAVLEVTVCLDLTFTSKMDHSIYVKRLWLLVPQISQHQTLFCQCTVVSKDKNESLQPNKPWNVNQEFSIQTNPLDEQRIERLKGDARKAIHEDELFVVLEDGDEVLRAFSCYEAG